MNKILASLACVMAVAMLSACGSQELPDPPPAAPNYNDYTDVEKTQEPNGSEETAVTVGTASLASGVKLKGTLSNKFENDNGKPIYVLDEDFYKVELMNGETISITASNASNIASSFNVKFYGPCHRPTLGCAIDSVDVTNQATLQKTIGAGDFAGGDTFDTRNTFFIKVSNVIKDTEGYFIYSSVLYALNIKLGNN